MWRVDLLLLGFKPPSTACDFYTEAKRAIFTLRKGKRHSFCHRAHFIRLAPPAELMISHTEDNTLHYITSFKI